MNNATPYCHAWCPTRKPCHAWRYGAHTHGCKLAPDHVPPHVCKCGTAFGTDAELAAIEASS